MTGPHLTEPNQARPDPNTVDQDSDSTASTAEPDRDERPRDLNAGLLARLFMVPLLIVLMIVGSSVVVVLLFGWISTSREESIDRLVTRLEAGAGEKVMSVALLPRDKEVWQAAMELANRLSATGGDGSAMLPAEERPEIAHRLEAVIARTREVEQEKMGQEMQQFILTALGQLGQPSSADLLTSFATDDRLPVDVRRHAVGGLVLMRNVPAARGRWPELAPLLHSPAPVLRIAGTVAIGVLADPGDSLAIETLTRAYRSDDREVVWNAAIALAQLGSRISVPTLQDMLDRPYWEQIVVRLPEGTGRSLSPVQVEGYLLLTIDAAAPMGDPALQPLVETLANDPSFAVRERAARALSARNAAAVRE